jgi:hypothetical protein
MELNSIRIFFYKHMAPTEPRFNPSLSCSAIFKPQTSNLKPQTSNLKPQAPRIIFTIY